MIARDYLLYSQRHETAWELLIRQEDLNRVAHSDPFAGLDVPEALQDSLKRHRENLAQLVRNLHSAGLDNQQIEASVSVIVESYKEELLRAIKALVEAQHA